MVGQIDGEPLAERSVRPHRVVNHCGGSGAPAIHRSRQLRADGVKDGVRDGVRDGVAEAASQEPEALGRRGGGRALRTGLRRRLRKKWIARDVGR